MWIETDIPLLADALLQRVEFIRQQWRMWIETGLIRYLSIAWRKFIRQQWRMWIETTSGQGANELHRVIHSPAMANVD